MHVYSKYVHIYIYVIGTYVATCNTYTYVQLIVIFNIWLIFTSFYTGIPSYLIKLHIKNKISTYVTLTNKVVNWLIYGCEYISKPFYKWLNVTK